MNENICKEGLSIIIPLCNEEGNVKSLIEAVFDSMPFLIEDFEVCVVDDGSWDNTYEICCDLKKSYPALSIFRHSKNQGYGAALRAGIKNTNKNWILFLDGDNQFDVADVTMLLKYKDAYDVITGYRKERKDPYSRFIISICYSLLARLLFKINFKDINCGFKLIKRRVFEEISLPKSLNFSFSLEVLLKASQKGIAIKQVPVCHFPRKYNSTHVFIFKNVFFTLLEIINLWLYSNFSFDRLYEKILSFRIFLNRFLQGFKFLSLKPILIYPVAKNYFDLVVRGKKVLRLVEIIIGYGCQCKCEQCSAAVPVEPAKQRLQLNELNKMVGSCIKLGVFQFNITGGEPLLYSEVYRIIEYIKIKKGFVNLVTNGILLNREEIIKLKKIGLDSLEMGIDSPDGFVHDKNRGQSGSFNKIMQSIDSAKKSRLAVILNTIITPQKIKNGDMHRLIELAKRKKVILQITLPCLVGKWSGREDLLLSWREKRYFRRLLRFRNVRIDSYSSYFKAGCVAGSQKIAITPYGDITPCSLIPVSFGNIRFDSLENIWKKMLKVEYFNKINPGCLPSLDKEFIKNYLMISKRAN